MSDSSSYMAVSARAVTKSFSKRWPVISDFSLNIPYGTSYAILGPSGCGKSTLLRLLAGADLPDRSAPCLTVLGEGPGRALRAGRVALLSSESTLLPWRSVLQNVRLPLDLLGHPRADADKRAISYIKRVRLTDMVERRPHQLSDGQRQRVRLAQALVTDPLLLMLDEPFSALDEGLRLALIAEVNTYLAESKQRTAVLVTHNSFEAVLLADRVLVVNGPPLQIVAERNGVSKIAPSQESSSQLQEWIVHQLLSIHR